MDTLKDFSDYALNQGWCVDGESTQNGFLFYNAQTNERWIGWQAAKAQAVPEGFVLMPMVPSERMVIAVRHCYEGESYLPYSLYSEFVNQAIIEAQEQSHE